MVPLESVANTSLTEYKGWNKCTFHHLKADKYTTRHPANYRYVLILYELYLLTLRLSFYSSSWTTTWLTRTRYHLISMPERSSIYPLLSTYSFTRVSLQRCWNPCHLHSRTFIRLKTSFVQCSVAIISPRSGTPFLAIWELPHSFHSVFLESCRHHFRARWSKKNGPMPSVSNCILASSIFHLVTHPSFEF